MKRSALGLVRSWADVPGGLRVERVAKSVGGCGRRVDQGLKGSDVFRVERKPGLVDQHVFGAPAGSLQNKVRSATTGSVCRLIDQVSLGCFGAQADGHRG